MSPLAKYSRPGADIFTPATLASNDPLYGGETVDTYQGREDYPVEETMNLPVRLHHSKLEVYLRDMLKELEQQKKGIQIARMKLMTVDHAASRLQEEANQEIRDAMLQLERDYIRLVEADKIEMIQMKQQITQINQDKIALQQNELILESRVTEAESEVGFRNFYESQVNLGSQKR